MGLKIIIVGNSLYINNPMNRVKINNYYLTPRPQENGFNLCLIIGIDKLLTDLEIEEDEFLELLKTAEEKENFVFIIIENPTRFKNHEYDSWYKNYISGDSGIWVGNGIEAQYLLLVLHNLLITAERVLDM